MFKSFLLLVTLFIVLSGNSYSQIKRGTKSIFGNASVSQSIFQETYTANGVSENYKLKDNQAFLKSGYAFAIHQNVFIGSDFSFQYLNSRQIEPFNSEGNTSRHVYRPSLFVRLLAPIPFTVKPYLQLSHGREWVTEMFNNDSGANEKYNYDVSITTISPALSIFNKDYSRSFDLGLNINFHNYKIESEADRYKGNGWFFGYTFYLQ